MLKTIKASKNYKSEQFIRVLTFQLSSGGSNYLQSGAVPTRGHIYFWVEAFANETEEEYKRKFLDFMKEELGRYDDFKDKFPVFKTSIRVLEGHVTDTSHPAMSSLKKAYKELGLNYDEGGLGFACDAFAFKKAGNTEVVVLGPKGENPHGMDEYVKVKDILELIKIMALTAIDYCGV